MDNVLYCIVNINALKQNIFIGDKDDSRSINPIAICDIKTLVSTLTKLAEEKGIKHIKLFGVKDYIEGLIKDFPNKDIEIEVN